MDGGDGGARGGPAVCVFCGSSGAVAEVYRDAATRLGTALGRAGAEMIYGGGRVGLMGLAADAALAAGARVTGIIPRFLRDWEVGHEGIDELVVTETMHERKRLMHERADGFVALPGGLGTFDETVEAMTWRQLGVSDKPIVLANVAGYWDPFLALLRHAEAAGFVKPEHGAIPAVADGPEEAVALLRRLCAGGAPPPVS